MNKQEFIRISAAINIAFKDTILGKEQMDMWFDNLNDLDYLITQRVVKRIVQESEYAPKIATIRKEYNNIKNGTKLTAEESLGLVNKTISNFGRYRYNEALEHLKANDEITYRIVQAIGYGNFCNANTDFVRKPFLDMYKESSTNLEKSLMLSDKFAKEISAIRDNGLMMLEAN